MEREAPSAGRTLILLGSARGDGNTRRAADRVCEQLGDRVTLIDLSRQIIRPFSYSSTDHGDDFLVIIDQMLAHQQIVFATPVYWYAMSGLMKTFFDRITDLLLDESKRGLARLLAGRSVWLLATGTGEELPPGFHEPFAGTAAYLAMHWQQAFYVRSSGETAASNAAQMHADQLALCLLGREARANYR